MDAATSVTRCTVLAGNVILKHTVGYHPSRHHGSDILNFRYLVSAHVHAHAHQYKYFNKKSYIRSHVSLMMAPTSLPGKHVVRTHPHCRPIFAIPLVLACTSNQVVTLLRPLHVAYIRVNYYYLATSVVNHTKKPPLS